MTIFDTVALILILLSAYIGFVRGLLKEFVSIVIWIAALFATKYGYPYVIEVANQQLDNEVLARVASIAFCFIVVFLALNLLSFLFFSFICYRFPLVTDRILGIFFGIFRGVLIISIFVMLGSFLRREEYWPDNVKNSLSIGFFKVGADYASNYIDDFSKDFDY